MAHIPVLVEKVVNVHEVELKTPPLPPSSQVTVPVGIIVVPRPGSLTLALKATVLTRFVDTGVETGVIVVVVVRRFTVNDVLPELVEWELSPP